ncbi:nucleoside recognition domain-containing protein [Bordetella sp. 2513F-2]
MPYLLKLWRRSAHLFVQLLKVMLPVMLLVQVGQWLGWIDAIGQAVGPAMALLDLPPEAGMIWIACVFVGLYGAIAALIGFAPVLDLTVAQFSALGAMMLFAHALPIEQAIVRRAGASFWATAALRLAAAVGYGALVAWACRLGGWLQQPVDFAWLPQAAAEAAGWEGVWQWMAGTAYSLGLTYAILVGLLILLDVLDRTGIMRVITAAMAPLLRLSGLDPRVTPVTTVGVLLGLTYGGALIIEEAERQQYPARTRFLALAWLSLSHSLIEDTLLLMTLGANGWVVLGGRVLITLAVVALLARLTRGATPGGVAAVAG